MPDARSSSGFNLNPSSLFRFFFSLIAFGILALLTAKAWSDVDPTYDSWYYHLPFAARLTGIFPASNYRFEHEIETIFMGFPRFGELIQGIFWRVSGRIECANLWSLFVLFGFLGFLKKNFSTPLRLSVPALIAIPLIQIHATLCYVDLPANLFLSMQVLTVFQMWVNAEKRDIKRLLFVVLFGALAAHTKFFMIPLAMIALCCGFALWFNSTDGKESLTGKILFLIGALVILWYPMRNTILFHNPVYPVRMPVLGSILPYYTTERLIGPPDYLRGQPNWLIWLYSVLEVNRSPFAMRVAHDISAPWLASQESIKNSEHMMGGFFSANVVFHTALFFVLSALRPRAERMKRWILIVVVTAAAIVMPQPHELRYYFFWILILIAINMDMLMRLDVKFANIARALVQLGVLSLFFWVVVLTRGVYLFPQHKPVESLLRLRMDPKIEQRLRSDEKTCLVQKLPYSFAYVVDLKQKGMTPRIQAARVLPDCEEGSKVVY